jgi:hypothetical protein
MAQQPSQNVPFSVPASRARPSQSQSLSTSPSSKSPLGQLEQRHDYEIDLDATLAHEIEEFWGVEDPALVVAEYGTKKIASIHRRMKSMSRRQKLVDVENLGGYFMRCLGQGQKNAASIADTEDAAYEAYLEKQRARGQRV